MLVLFETPAGYAIFKVRISLFGIKEILLLHPKIVFFACVLAMTSFLIGSCVFCANRQLIWFNG